MRPIKFITITFLIFTLAGGCIKEVQFSESPPPNLLVVDGRITTSEGPHILYLGRLVRYGQQIRRPVPDAEVRLVDDEGRTYAYQYVPAEERYELTGVKGEIGRTYSIEIRTGNEQVYHSEPETLLPVPEIDSLSYNVRFEETQTEAGTLIDRYFFNLFVNTRLHPMEEGPYLRWEVDYSYSFTEIQVHPLKIPATCYMTEPFDPFRIKLFNGSEADGQSIRVDLGSRSIDWRFNWRNYFNVYQSSLTEEAFRYWTNIDKVSDPSGTIFDAPPAAVRGNIRNINNTDEQVLGYFGASAIDTMRIFTTKYDIAPVAAPAMIPLCRRTPGSSRIPPACSNCMSLPNSSYERPDYW